MSTHTTLHSLQNKITLLSKRTSLTSDYRTAIIELLRRALPFDAACLTAVDPSTLLSTGAVADESVEAMHARLFANEYGESDVNKYRDLASSDHPVATLSEATHGQAESSIRFRSILSPSGFQDELRAALLVHGTCWGYLTLFRRYGKPTFQEEERALIASISLALALRVRQESLRQPARQSPNAGIGYGLVLLTQELSLTAADEAGGRWLNALREREQLDGAALPRPVRAVGSAALSREAGQGQAKASLRAPDGTLLVIRGTLLEGKAGSGPIAVHFEEMSARDRIQFMSEAYGLTPREKELYSHVLQGRSTKELAHSLGISTYTVQDHLKSIFFKTGVSSRRELIGRHLG
ncbi:LuxR C-terminal-related transcriptional regulator [Gorillibacterium sp. CAU 1737]|uniref:LuxR C-terminal-related transcriptional regulator n=1 Tax=Gorillibacterium sp. CAU 1737 TaxID=3140362 RepID=UPI003260FA90